MIFYNLGRKIGRQKATFFILFDTFNAKKSFIFPNKTNKSLKKCKQINWGGGEGIIFKIGVGEKKYFSREYASLDLESIKFKGENLGTNFF